MIRRSRVWLSLGALLALGAACDFSTRIAGSAARAPHPLAAPETSSAPTATPSANPSDLGERPKLGAPKTFAPAVPQEFVVNGIRVWLLERADLPLVSASFVVQNGVSSDPKDKPGLASLTSDMMDEGAGKLGAVQISTAIADLGASLSVASNLDGGFASVSSLKQHFGKAFAILSDVVARPTFDATEFKRVAGLWKNALKKRADDPGAVATLVAQSAMFGRDTPYGHPSLGLLSKADGITLADVKKFHQAVWRPDKATLVIVGQIDKAEVEALLTTHLGDWKPQGEPLAAVSVTGPKVRSERPRLIVVNRPKAVQSMIMVAREGVSMSDPDRPLLDLVNTALGGSFTSRLNHNLREDKGWTYGAGSAFASTRNVGMFYVRTAVEAKVTGVAAAEILHELELMAEKGLTDEEFEKVKAQDRADLVETYETGSGASGRFSTFAALGLPSNQDVVATQKRQASTKNGLAALARSHVDPAECTFVIVGDSATILPQLTAAGFEPAAVWSTEGEPLTKK
ncbi:MAG: pitrilysin family protein [Polyangiaceae bacterium]